MKRDAAVVGEGGDIIGFGLMPVEASTLQTTFSPGFFSYMGSVCRIEVIVRTQYCHHSQPWIFINLNINYSDPKLCKSEYLIV